ncbi:MAG TPA: N-acetylneuraminate synthase family protein [Gaiellaceae bacterium]|nr:N-acetylneuraminate synthase family protein [Gaiellaceae bacterium]
MRDLVVDGTRISQDGDDCYVIAEVGHNHQGSLIKAIDHLRAAKDAGADAVKLQKRSNATLYTRAMYDQYYDHENSFGRTYGEHREALELSDKDWFELMHQAKEIGITLFGTAFDEPSADLLAEIGSPAFKIASADLVNTPLLRQVASYGKPVFLSTGGGTMDDIERAVDAILPINEQLVVMQCTAAYPAEAEDLNLRVVSSLRERFPDVVIGLSDHQSGYSMSLLGYMLGARVIEKHFTLNHSWKGTDHAFSLMPDGMRRLVRDLRRAPLALGDGVKRPLPSEESAIRKMGKNLVASRDLPKGHVLVPGDLDAKSPADGGLPPYELEQLLGRRLSRSLSFEQAVTFEDLVPVEQPLAAPGSAADR